MADGGIEIDVSTGKIPLSLRKVDSRFYSEIRKNDDVLIKDSEEGKL